MLNLRTLLRPVAPVIALAALAAPAQAKHVTITTEGGAAQILDAPLADPAMPGATGSLPGVGDSPDVPGGALFDDLPDLFPGGDDLPGQEPLLPAATTTIPGTVARLRTDGRAAIPRGAPKRVRSLISQYNRIVGKRYKWGGGHAVVEDRGYDCSGAVGYGLIRTGMLSTTMVSGTFARWAAAGTGRWMTIYANRTHVYTEIAGLRLDTSAVGDPAGAHGVRWRPLIGARNGFKVRHPVGL